MISIDEISRITEKRNHLKKKRILKFTNRFQRDTSVGRLA